MTTDRRLTRLALLAPVVAALVFAGGCGGGTEPTGTVAPPARDVPPATRESPGATRESPGATRESPGTTREPPGTGREPPSGGTTEPPGTTGGCLVCPQLYTCVVSLGDQSSEQPLYLTSAGGGECGVFDSDGSIVFHCDGTLTLTGDSVGTATGWRSTGGGGFRVLGAAGNVRCSPTDVGTAASAPSSP